MSERRTNRRRSAKEQDKLQVKVCEMMNQTRHLKHRLEKAEEKASESSCDEELALSLLQCMTPNSKSKTLKRVASTLGLSPVWKQL